MQFLNLELSSSDIESLKIEFSDGINIISVQDKELFNVFKHIPELGIYKSESDASDHTAKNISCRINFLPGLQSIRSKTGYRNGLPEAGDLETFYGISKTDVNPDLPENRGICTYADFVVSSYYYPELVRNNNDPVFENKKLKTLFINNEVYHAGFSYFENRELLLQNQEKELTDINREKQLLELKKMKKVKLKKEIHITERIVQKLEKRKESINEYKVSLDEIISQIEKRNRTSSKINNLKKDLIELREIKEKISSVEKTLKEKFSHFYGKGNDQIPDLEQIQVLFNSFRDINEKLDKFSLKKKNYTGWVIKIIASMVIFSFTALFFLLFTSTASYILGLTAGIAAAAAGVTSLLYYFRFRNIQPLELFEQKMKMESDLVDLLKRNSFSVDDYKTGELYEILFQYFEDFINYRDINYELMELRKKIASSQSLAEKEKKLEQVSEEIENIDNGINKSIENLDQSIHPRPELNSMTRTIHDIDELLEENENEINEKKMLISKFEAEIEEYDRLENSSSSVELKLEEVLKRIDICRERMEHIKFLNGIFDETADAWSRRKLEDLSRITLEKFLKITGNSFNKDEIADIINGVILENNHIKNENKEMKKYLSFSIRAALSEILVKENIPPVFLIDPFTSDNEFADNMKKLLPEFFQGRQVVLIVPGNPPDIKGNLINL